MSDLLWLSEAQMRRIEPLLSAVARGAQGRRSSHPERHHLRDPQRAALAGCSQGVRPVKGDLAVDSANRTPAQTETLTAIKGAIATLLQRYASTAIPLTKEQEDALKDLGDRIEALDKRLSGELSALNDPRVGLPDNSDAADRIHMVERLTFDIDWEKINEVYASGQGETSMAFISWAHGRTAAGLSGHSGTNAADSPGGVEMAGNLRLMALGNVLRANGSLSVRIALTLEARGASGGDHSWGRMEIEQINIGAPS